VIGQTGQFFFFYPLLIEYQITRRYIEPRENFLLIHIVARKITKEGLDKWGDAISASFGPIPDDSPAEIRLGWQG
jgi:hypothetical protein